MKNIGNNNIRLELGGIAISADKFIKSVNSFFDIIDEVTVNITGKKKEIQWNVSVESGSANVIATPVALNGSPDLVDLTVDRIQQGIKTLEKKAERPANFTDTALRNIHDLAYIVDEKKQEFNSICIWIKQKPQQISLRSAANVDKIMGIKYRDYGSIEGKLQVISVRKNLKFVVYDDLSDQPIKCYFKSGITEEVVSAFDKRVSVYGLIMYKSQGEPYSVRVEQLKVFKEQDELPTINDVLGIMKD